MTGRRRYLTLGLQLAALKYAGDLALVFVTTGAVWTPLDYLTPIAALFSHKLAQAPRWLLPVMAVWTVPFLWVGVKLSAERSADAGRSPWLSLWFFVPYANYAFIVTLCLLPTASTPPDELRVRALPLVPEGRLLPVAARAIAIGLAIGLVMALLGLILGKAYGASILLGTPFVMGAVASFILNRSYDVRGWETARVTAVMFVVAGAAFLLFAFEGAVCIVMAFPLALSLGIVGAALGRELAGRGAITLKHITMGLLVLPVGIAVEPAGSADRAIHEVQSSVTIAASPEAVWPHVIAFRPIDAPEPWLFRFGVASPQSARIEGTGVGAIRYCRFSTGDFVEPITHWEPGRRLAFDVSASPPPMRELSPYDISPPHLDGILKSVRGEFRLVPLPDGGTRLEGSTWYVLGMTPEPYWRMFSDAIIHQIHLRVLEHIKREVTPHAAR